MLLIKKTEYLDTLERNERIAAVAKMFEINESIICYIKKYEEKIQKSIKDRTFQSAKTCLCAAILTYRKKLRKL